MYLIKYVFSFLTFEKKNEEKKNELSPTIESKTEDSKVEVVKYFYSREYFSKLNSQTKEFIKSKSAIKSYDFILKYGSIYYESEKTKLFLTDILFTVNKSILNKFFENLSEKYPSIRTYLIFPALYDANGKKLTKYIDEDKLIPINYVANIFNDKKMKNILSKSKTLAEYAIFKSDINRIYSIKYIDDSYDKYFIRDEVKKYINRK